MLIYALISLAIGIFLTISIVKPILQEAFEDCIDNEFTNYPTLTLSINIVLFALFWPAIIPVVVSDNIKNLVIQGFTKVIYSEKE